MDFTTDDMNVLLEAMEAWESKDMAVEIMGEMLAGVMTDRRDPIAKAQLEAERAERQKKSSEARQHRKERSVLLRAKLIQMRDAMSVADMVAETLGR